DEDLLTKFEESLRERLKSQESTVESGRDVNHLLRLVGNTKLRNLVVGADFDDFNDQELATFLEELNEVVVNSLSTMQKIKTNRVRWSEIIKEIELRTMSVDSFYSAGEYDKY